MTENEMLTIESKLKEGMKLAGESPGIFGGRLFVRTFIDDADIYVILDHDDPMRLIGQPDVDAIAQCMPDKVLPIGRAANWINEDGTVDRSYFA